MQVNEVEDLRENTRVSNNNVCLIEREVNSSLNCCFLKAMISNLFFGLDEETILFYLFRNVESGERKIKVYKRHRRKKAAEESGKGSQGSEKGPDKLLTQR